MKRWWMIAAVFTAGCGPVANPLIEAHRGAAGYWPQNSASAVRGSVAADFDGLEVDLVLTRDGEAVLSHDPWLSPDHCTDAEGNFLEERVRIDRVDLRELQRNYLCGGIPDDEHPNAEVVAEPVLSFDELIEAVADASAGLRLHLDVKVEKGWTKPADAYLEPILDRWWAADRPQTITVSANTPEVLVAFEAHARAQDRDLHTVLIYPFAPSDKADLAVGLGAEGDSLLGKVDYIDRIEEAHADGIAVQFEVAERGQLQAARDAGYETALWTLNDGPLLQAYARWPIDVPSRDRPAPRHRPGRPYPVRPRRPALGDVGHLAARRAPAHAHQPPHRRPALPGAGAAGLRLRGPPGGPLAAHPVRSLRAPARLQPAAAQRRGSAGGGPAQRPRPGSGPPSGAGSGGCVGQRALHGVVGAPGVDRLALAAHHRPRLRPVSRAHPEEGSLDVRQEVTPFAGSSTCRDWPARAH